MNSVIFADIRLHMCISNVFICFPNERTTTIPPASVRATENNFYCFGPVNYSHCEERMTVIMIITRVLFPTKVHMYFVVFDRFLSSLSH